MTPVWQLVKDGTPPLLRDIPTLDVNKLGDVALKNSYLIVDGRAPQDAIMLIDHLRGETVPAIYLRPLVVLHDGIKKHQIDLLGADELCSINDFTEGKRDALGSQFTAVNRWINEVGSSVDTSIPLRILRHLVSRNRPLKPVPSALDRNGFVYPPIQRYIGGQQDGALHALEFLHSERLITGEFEARAHFCAQCECAFLNFQEACPHCKSTNLVADDLVHHFRCAHTAPLSDYKVDDRLVCPKCDRELRHIGVDYDKPSTVYDCNDCNHRFQDSLVLASCYDCGRTTEPENHTIRSIYQYEITALGVNAARFGLDSLFSRLLEKRLKLYDTQTFEAFVAIEAARISRYKRSESAVLGIRIQNLDALYLELGERAASVFSELSDLFKTVLRQTDLITARNESVFLVLLAETSIEQAERVIERLEAGVADLMQANLQHHIAFETRVEPVDDQLDLDVLLERLLSSDAD